MVAGLGSIAAKGLQGYMQGRAIKKGEEKDAAAAERQSKLDALDEERIRASIDIDRQGLDLRRREMTLGQERFDATHALARDRAAREAETHGFAVDGLRADAETRAATDQVFSIALAGTMSEAAQSGKPVSELMSSYGKRVSDGILMTTGDVALAERWREYAGSTEAAEHMETWDKARFAIDGGDFDTGLDLLGKLYNDRIPDGYTYDGDASGVARDSQGNIVGIALRFTGPDGQTMEHFAENAEELFAQALPQLDPAAAFQAQMEEVAAADAVRADLSADQRSRLADARAAVVELFNRKDVVQPLTPEERAAAEAEIYRTFGFDPKGNPLKGGEQRDVEAEAPFSGLR